MMTKTGKDRITHIRYRGFFINLVYEEKDAWFGKTWEVRPLVTWNGLGLPWFDPSNIDNWYRPWEIEIMVADIRGTIDAYLDKDDSIPF